MRLFPLTKNNIALAAVAIVTLGFFVAGMFKVLDYAIIKFLLFFGFAALLVIAIGFAIKNDNKKNHPKEKPQNDSH